MNIAHYAPDLVIPAAYGLAALASRRMRIRKTPASLRAGITRNLRDWSGLASLQAAYITLFTSLHAAGLLRLSAMLAGVIVSGLYLAIDLYMITWGLRMRREYDANPAIAYLAEIRNAFGPLVFYARASQPCEACRLLAVHYPTCECGHCPADPGTVIHRSLADSLLASIHL